MAAIILQVGGGIGSGLACHCGTLEIHQLEVIRSPNLLSTQNFYQ
jgi:hypothetical protein